MTRTQGVVYHMRNWLSLVGNWSTNIGVPTLQDRLLPDGKIPNPNEGESRNFGFALDLFNRRLSFKTVYYQTESRGQTRSGGINAQFNNRNIRVANALEGALVDVSRRYSAAEWAPIRSSLGARTRSASSRPTISPKGGCAGSPSAPGIAGADPT